MDTRIKTQQFGIGDIFAEGWRVYRSQFVKDPADHPVCVCPPRNLQLAIEKTPLWLWTLATSLFAPIASVAIAYVVERTIQGQDVAWGDALRHGLSRWPSIFGTSFVAGLILLGLTLLLIIPGVIWSVYYAFYIYVVALRDIGGKEALDYSKNLVEGQWWRVAGIWLVITAVLYGVTLIVALPFVIVASVSGIQILVNVAGAINSVAAALFTVIMVVWFLNIDYLKNAVPAAGERGVSLDTPYPTSGSTLRLNQQWQ